MQALPTPFRATSSVRSVVDQSRGYAPSGIIGPHRAWTVSMISALSDDLKVDRGDAEVAVAKLALDDDERHDFASHLDGLGVSELIRREAPANAGCYGPAA